MSSPTVADGAPAVLVMPRSAFGATASSKAPMSSAAPWGLGVLRWSVVRFVLPESNAGLVLVIAWVGVGPPLLAIGPSPGSAVIGAVPTALIDDSTTFGPVRLALAAAVLAAPLATVAGAPDCRSFPPAVSARIEFVIVTVAA